VSATASKAYTCPLCLAAPLQLGHQAVECPNGTVNWKGIYGDDAFVLRPPVYESQLRERRLLRTCDEDAVRKAAEQYAKVGAFAVQHN
jgi:hypothetical protein